MTVWRPYVQRNAKRQGKGNDSVWVTEFENNSQFCIFHGLVKALFNCS